MDSIRPRPSKSTPTVPPKVNPVSVDPVPEPKKHWLKWLLVISASLILLLGITGLLIWSWYLGSLQPVDRSSEASEFVTIESGMGPKAIAELLDEKELIQQADTFSWYVRQRNVGGQLKAGVYSFSPSMSVEKIVDLLVAGKTATITVQIPPGFRLDQIEDRLVKAGFDRTEAKSALAASYSHPVLASKPTESSLEGYIFPDTYSIDYNSDISVLMGQIFTNFDNKLTSQLEADLKAQGLSIHEAITMASIIQKESSDPEVQRQIAQVFLKRLAIGMPLGADATFLYAAAIDGKPPTVDYDSPYNTRIHAGLPPGPISNFNLSALEAVADPAPGEYLYYVAGDDGITRFSETLKEHEEKTDKYCHERCKL